jgi:hypothetical protein
MSGNDHSAFKMTDAFMPLMNDEDMCSAVEDLSADVTVDETTSNFGTGAFGTPLQDTYGFDSVSGTTTSPFLDGLNTPMNSNAGFFNGSERYSMPMYRNGAVAAADPSANANVNTVLYQQQQQQQQQQSHQRRQSYPQPQKQQPHMRSEQQQQPQQQQPRQQQQQQKQKHSREAAQSGDMEMEDAGGAPAARSARSTEAKYRDQKLSASASDGSQRPNRRAHGRRTFHIDTVNAKRWDQPVVVGTPPALPSSSSTKECPCCNCLLPVSGPSYSQHVELCFQEQARNSPRPSGETSHLRSSIHRIRSSVKGMDLRDRINIMESCSRLAESSRSSSPANSMPNSPILPRTQDDTDKKVLRLLFTNRSRSANSTPRQGPIDSPVPSARVVVTSSASPGPNPSMRARSSSMSMSVSSQYHQQKQQYQQQQRQSQQHAKKLHMRQPVRMQVQSDTSEQKSRKSFFPHPIPKEQVTAYQQRVTMSTNSENSSQNQRVRAIQTAFPAKQQNDSRYSQRPQSASGLGRVSTCARLGFNDDMPQAPMSAGPVGSVNSQSMTIDHHQHTGMQQQRSGFSTPPAGAFQSQVHSPRSNRRLFTGSDAPDSTWR